MLLDTLLLNHDEAGRQTRLIGIEVGAFYWTDMAPDFVNPGREEQGSASGLWVRRLLNSFGEGCA
jgi:hypothetical protein